MKKIILTVATALCFSGAIAQDLTSKKGEPILPEADDWAVSIEATPFLFYFGNMLNGNTGNPAPTWNFLNSNNMIIGKMFVDEKTAYRAGIRIGMVKQTFRNQIMQASSTVPTFPTVPTLVEDVYKRSINSFGISGGIEKRRGKTRLQGVYGADLLIWLSGSKQTFEYGNALAPAGTPPVNSNDPIYTTFWSPAGTSTGAYAGSVNSAPYYGARATEIKNGMSIGFGVRGFIGAEYFIFPKISIGGEFGWGIGIQTPSKSTSSYEATGGAPAAVGTYSTEMKGSSWFLVDTDRNAFGTAPNQFSPTGSLRMNFHF